MIRGMYDAGAALQNATVHHEVLAENLANVTTPGYRRHGISFSQTLEPQQGAVTNPGFFTKYTPGPFQQTGNPLDLAISGEAFFVLEGPNGPVYTRNGSFELNEQGDLQSTSGLRVRGQGGRISVPRDAGQIIVNQEGVILADGGEVGRLQLATFENPRALQRVGPTLFEGPAPTEPEAGAVRVEQGYKEGSNVEAVQEMIAMMIGMRQYEAAEKALRAIGEAVALNTRPQT
jgi:flagellar basal-body rod protein FlgF